MNENNKKYKETHLYTRHITRYTQRSLAEAANMDYTALNKYIKGVKIPNLNTVMRVIAVLDTAEPAALEIIESAGRSIKYDCYPENRAYRALVSMQGYTAERKNELLEPYGTGILKTLKRYK